MERFRSLGFALLATLALALAAAGCVTDQPTAPGTPAPIGQTQLPVDPSPGQFAPPGQPAAP